MEHGLSPFFPPAPLFRRGKGETELGYETESYDGACLAFWRWMNAHRKTTIIHPKIIVK
ncbi:MAG: hypothetical protein K9H64_08445 [Bacteroidales bacterium]|nr:hypothetical protein [Bacteroidales bacterium]